MQSALWALFNVSADQHVLRCLRVTDAADTIVEICVVSGRGTSSIYLLLGTGRIVMRAHPASTPRARHTTTRPSSEYGRERETRCELSWKNSQNHQGPGSKSANHTMGPCIGSAHVACASQRVIHGQRVRGRGSQTFCTTLPGEAPAA
jgi:hypothetical protein